MSTFPGLRRVAVDLDAGNMTEQEIEACAKVVLDRYKHQNTINYTECKHLVQQVIDTHEIDKQALIAAGRPREKVEAMPHFQVALLHGMLEYDTLIDQTLVWYDLPYWETAARSTDLHQQNQKERQTDPKAPALAIAQLLFPGHEKVAARRAQNERKIALLRTIESFRYYAATLDGQLPPSLAAVKEVTIPIDPITGKDFDYHLTDGAATLHAATPSNAQANSWNTVAYELRMKKGTERP